MKRTLKTRCLTRGLTRSLAAAALMLSPGAALADLYIANSYLPPPYPQPEQGYTQMFERIREATNGAFEFETHFGGSLLPGRTTLTGIRFGVAEVGIVYPPYTPAELPISDFLGNLSFKSSDSLVAALAYTEINYTSAALREEWHRFNIVFGGAFATPAYQFLCNTPVTDLAQARGKRMRTAGSSFTGLVTSLGGTAVSVPIGDAYSGMQRGSLECTIADPTNMLTASLRDVVTDVTMVNVGLVPGATWAYSEDFWTGLTTEQRTLFLDEMALSLIRQQQQFTASVEETFADAATRGIEVHEPEPDLAQHVAEIQARYVDTLVTNVNPRLVPDARGLADEYAALQEKWTGLLATVDRKNEAAVLAVVNEHLMSKVDPAVYGVDE